jgi:hypothetical protein
LRGVREFSGEHPLVAEEWLLQLPRDSYADCCAAWYRCRLWQDKLLLLALIATFYAFSSYVRVAIRTIIEGPTFQWACFAGVKADGVVAVVSG